jgi:hypothetical protein
MISHAFNAVLKECKTKGTKIEEGKKKKKIEKLSGG